VVRIEPTTATSSGGIAIEFEQLDHAAREAINRAVRSLRNQPR
jgi:hypothetical protein